MGPVVPDPKVVAPLVMHAQRTLSVSQHGLGKVLGVSRRTIWRYQSAQTVPLASALHVLARMVHPKDAALAKALAEAGGQTLQSLGIETAAAPVDARPADARATRLLIDAIVCAAAEALDASPRALRPVLHAAFACAAETGLSIDEVEKALAPIAPGSAGKRERRPPPLDGK